MKKKELYLLSGFLGAGKTTFLRSLLDIFSGKKVGIIENEFGQESIDGIILKREGFQVAEISNGSIFCACRSDLFIDALIDCYSRDLEIIIVESSGLADPTEMPEILQTIKKIKGDIFEYKGNIAIVDAVNFHKVLNTAVVVKNQIMSADLILVNKIDQVFKEKLPEIEEKIRSINEKPKVLYTTFGKIDDPRIILNLSQSFDQYEDVFRVKTINNQKAMLEIDERYSENIFLNWLKEISPFTYRIKGFVRLNGQIYEVDSVSEDIKFFPSSLMDHKKLALVILGNKQKSLKKMIPLTWKSCLNRNFIIRKDR